MQATQYALPAGGVDLVTGTGGRAQRIKAIVGASSGNLVEWYDFYAYAFTSSTSPQRSSRPAMRRAS